MILWKPYIHRSPTADVPLRVHRPIWAPEPTEADSGSLRENAINQRSRARSDSQIGTRSSRFCDIKPTGAATPSIGRIHVSAGALAHQVDRATPSEIGNKNSPRQLESEAGLSLGIPRPVSGDSRRGGPPSIGEPCWTTTTCCRRTASHHLSQAGLQSNQRDDSRRSTSSTGASREPQTLSRELRAMGYRKLSARPRHHAGRGAD